LTLKLKGRELNAGDGGGLGDRYISFDGIQSGSQVRKSDVHVEWINPDPNQPNRSEMVVKAGSAFIPKFSIGSVAGMYDDIPQYSLVRRPGSGGYFHLRCARAMIAQPGFPLITHLDGMTRISSSQIQTWTGMTRHQQSVPRHDLVRKADLQDSKPGTSEYHAEQSDEDQEFTSC
jgi:hypothetical protein